MENAAKLNSIDEITKQVEEKIQKEEILYSTNQSISSFSLTSKDIKTALKRNEDGDAELFISLHKDKFCYDHSLGKWFKWGGHFWQEDIIGDVFTGIESVIEMYSQEAKRQSSLRLNAARTQDAAKEKDAKQLEDKLLKRVHDLQTVYRKKHVLYLASKGLGSLAITGEEWDKDPWLLGCNNGVIDLKTGDFNPGRPEDYIKTIATSTWKGIDESAPVWEKFLLEIFSENIELVQYIQRLFGYSIAGVCTEHILPICWGKGRNGKGTLLETLSYVLGLIAGPVQAEMLLSESRARQAGGPRADIMTLMGRRLCWGSETEEGSPINIGKVKLLTGADTLSARPPHGKRVIEFIPTHTLLLLTNHKPHVPANEDALWERVHLIPFELKFVDEPKLPNDKKRDPDLPEKLKREASGILAWLVRGCLKWQEVGLKPPDIVKEATKQYRIDEDIIGQFLTECTCQKSKETARAQPLYNAYKLWCENNGYKPLGGKKFGERMKERFIRKGDSKGNFYKGVSILNNGLVTKGYNQIKTV